jgi:putative NADH-flavin reductase
MRVAVVGASGRTGRATVARLAETGHDVIAIVRTPATAPDGATARIADARDVAALTAALLGADAVVSCLGHVAGSDDTTVLHEGAIALLSALAETTVSRLVAVSAAGAYVQGDDPLSRFIAKPLVARLFGEPFADTREMERVIRAGSVDWTILRPSRLIPGTSSKPYRAGIDRAVWWHYNTKFDTVARAAVDALSTPAWVGHAVFLTD